MATVRHVTSHSGLRKFQADGFLLDWVYRRLGGPQDRSERAENLVPTGIRSRTVQSVVSRYTNWATRPTCKVWANKIQFLGTALQLFLSHSEKMFLLINRTLMRCYATFFNLVMHCKWASYSQLKVSFNDIELGH